MAGNLQFFLGRETMNNYAEKLHASRSAAMGGTPRSAGGCRTAHLWRRCNCALLQRDATAGRATQKSSPQGSTYASRTMYWSGPIIAFFVVYHLLHLTTGTVHPDFE